MAVRASGPNLLAIPLPGWWPPRCTSALSPVPLDFTPLHGDKWLFWGRTPDAAQSTARVAASASRATSPGGRDHAAGFGAS